VGKQYLFETTNKNPLINIFAGIILIFHNYWSDC